jgi:hypothetical protein
VSCGGVDGGEFVEFLRGAGDLIDGFYSRVCEFKIPMEVFGHVPFLVYSW